MTTVQNNVFTRKREASVRAAHHYGSYEWLDEEFEVVIHRALRKDSRSQQRCDGMEA